MYDSFKPSEDQTETESVLSLGRCKPEGLCSLFHIRTLSLVDLSGTQGLANTTKMQRTFLVQKTMSTDRPMEMESSLPQGKACVEGKGVGGEVHRGRKCITTIHITRLSGGVENNIFHFATVDTFFF